MFFENFKCMRPLVREIWPCFRDHATAQMTDVPYPVLFPWLMHNWCRVFFLTPPSLCQKVSLDVTAGSTSDQGQLRSIMGLLWPKAKFPTWPSEVKKYMFRCILEIETWWCSNESATFLSLKIIRKQNCTSQNCYCMCGRGLTLAKPYGFLQTAEGVRLRIAKCNEMCKV